jgi:integrase
MSKSTATAGARKANDSKPGKPYEGFPLFPHASGRWAKKVRQKLHYFGKWSDPEAALNKWLDQKDDLLAGRKPRGARVGLTIKDLVNRFLSVKKQRLDNGELSGGTFTDYHRTCSRVVEAFGRTRIVEDLAADDFESVRASLAKTLGVHALGKEVRNVRTLMKYAYEAGLIDRPVRFGPMFTQPGKKAIRKHRQANGVKMFEAAELRKIISAAGVPLKAMILLGINCGFGNHDCGSLPMSALDLTAAWVTFPRPKTAITRRCPLWPETVKALKAAIAERPQPKRPEDAELVFVTKYGQSWSKVNVPVVITEGFKEVKRQTDNPISKEMAKLLRTLGLQRRGVNFYGLRHSFETIGGGSRDQVAVDSIMGHSDESMAATYRERIEDERLHAVVNHVHGWLFAKKVKAK